MKPRPYQSESVRKIRQELRTKDSTLAVLATGLGKTVILSLLAREWDGRVLVLAHREELVRQAAAKLEAVTGENPGIEMASDRVNERSLYNAPRLVVASVQTLCRPNRQARFRPDAFSLVVIDEAHHAVANTYRSILEYFSEAKVLGVTATPRRSDQLAMGKVFQSVAYDYGIEAAIDDGWLVPVRQNVVKVEGLDFSKARTVAGDFNEADLNRILTEEKHLHAVASPSVKEAGDQSTLVFCVGVNHSKLLAEVINRYKPKSAIHLDGSTDKERRAEVVEQFKRGEIQFLCNCGLFLEGFDAPNTSVVVMARPTKSLPLYTQILGRGTRPLPGVVDGEFSSEDEAKRSIERLARIQESKKPYMTVLDFVGNSGRHKIVTASDLLGGKWSEKIRTYAKKTAESEGGEAGIAERMERAQAELDLLEEEVERNREEQRRRRLVAESNYRTDEVSPFDGRHSSHSSTGNSRPVELATDRQVWFLVKRLGWSQTKAMALTKRQASGIIGKAKGVVG